jgi:hypothetical protein
MASRFWVGGTGTWDASDTTHWAATSGGAGGQSVPGSADTVTFDGSSGGGTVTVNTTVNVVSIAMPTFTGHLNFSVNNNDVTVQTFGNSGTATRTLSMGNGAWTITGTGNSAWNHTVVTGLTFNKNSANITLSAGVSAARTFQAGPLTYNDLTIGAASNSTLTTLGTGAYAFNNLIINAGSNVSIVGGATVTANALNIAGSSGTETLITSNAPGTAATLSVASGTQTFDWCALRDLTFSGGATFAATNSFDLRGNSGITITPPAGGGSTGYPASRKQTGM